MTDPWGRPFMQPYDNRRLCALHLCRRPFTPRPKTRQVYCCRQCQEVAEKITRRAERERKGPGRGWRNNKESLKAYWLNKSHKILGPIEIRTAKSA